VGSRGADVADGRARSAATGGNVRDAAGGEIRASTPCGVLPRV